MAYSDFTFLKLRKQYKILQDTRNLFPVHFNEAAVSERLIADIEEGRTVSLISEKAKSEFLIAPVIK